MAKIIRFPEKNDKIQAVKKTNQKVLLFISLASVLLFAVVLNFSYQSKMRLDRDVANVSMNKLQDSMASDTVSNLNSWVLTSLNSSSQKNEIVFAEKPSAEEQLVYASLIGRYDITKTKDLITELNLKSGSQPVNMTQLPKLLNQYRQANGLENVEYKLIKKEEGEHIYEMYSQSKKLGQISLKLSEDKALLSLRSHWN